MQWLKTVKLCLQLNFPLNCKKKKKRRWGRRKRKTERKKKCLHCNPTWHERNMTAGRAEGKETVVFILWLKYFTFTNFTATYDQVNRLLGPLLGTLKVANASEGTWSLGCFIVNLVQVFNCVHVNKKEYGSCQIYLTRGTVPPAKTLQLHSPG